VRLSGYGPTLRAAIQADPTLKAEAQAELTRLIPAITQKCYISKTKRTALEEALR
jgi:hypothetical protein